MYAHKVNVLLCQGMPLKPERGETMKEHVEQINHLAEVLYSESKGYDTVSKGKAQLYQDIIDEMQEHIDSIVNELRKAEI